MTAAEHQARLWQAAATGGLQDVVEAGRAITGCNILLGDPILAVIAAACEADTEGWSWEDFIQAGYAPDFQEEVSFSREKRLFFTPQREGWYGTLPNSAYTHILLDLHNTKGTCCHLSVSHKDAGVLQDNMELVDVMSQALLAVINRTVEESDNRISMERFLGRLLEGGLREEEMLEIRARLMDFPTEGFFALLTVDIGSYRPSENSLSTVVGRLERFGGGASIIHGQRLVFLQSYATEEELEDEERRKEMAACLKENGLTGARSRAFFTLRDVPLHFRQTEELLRLSYVARQESLLEFSRMASYLLAGKLPQEERRLSACHPVIRRLAELDQESKFGYLETLKAYLLCGQRGALACQRLHIHRNTLDYRLRKLEEQVPIDWTDGELMFQLYFSIQLLEVLGHTEA